MSQPSGGWYSPLGPQDPHAGQPGRPEPLPATTAGWFLVGAAALAFVSGFLPFWSTTVTVGVVGVPLRWDGWSSWWWIPLLLSIAVGVGYVLLLFGVLRQDQVKPVWLLWGALAAFVLMLGVLLDTLNSRSTYFSAGPQFGVVIALLATATLGYSAALVAQSSGTRLPFRLPGPR